MPRPTTKQDLIEAANAQFDALGALIDGMSDVEKNTVFDFGDLTRRKEAHWKRDQNLRDVLIHLYEWHQLLLRWVAANESSDAAPFLPAPYNWKTYGAMNEAFRQKHQGTTLAEASSLLQQSHADVMACIARFSSDALFAKQQLAWTGGSTLGSYCVSATASHYDWAIKKIKVHRKACAARAQTT